MKTERTTQADLLRLAERHKEAHSHVRSLVNTIQVDTMTAASQMKVLEACVNIAHHQITGELGFQVAMDQSALVKASSDVAVRLSIIASDYVHLAVALQDLGEDINY